MIALLSLAHATSSYDPGAFVEYTGEETYTIDGSQQLWASIERHSDANAELFGPADYNRMTAWPEDSSFAPWIAQCFGTSTPETSEFLLHVAPREATSWGTPILFVPGAGDNGSRGFITMAWHMDLESRPTYALTFAHPHGDVFEQAEIVADAIARIKERTGAEQVDLVSHSKGGIASAIYLSNTAGAQWGDEGYEAVGTPYRGDVRKAVFIATPFAGIDTAYRWTMGNLTSLDAASALSPSSWEAYYPYTTGTWTYYEDLTAQDFFSDGDADLFPGQRQLLARQPYALPGELTWLGAYALQPDWYTTYEGGIGYWSVAAGIDDAVAAGGDFIETLAAHGIDPDVRLYVVAGENPVMPNGAEDLVVETFGEGWAEVLTSSADAWGQIIAGAVGDGLLGVGVTEEEVAGLASGDLVLGEISGPSDGLVFVDSATAIDRLTGRGAEVVDTYVANLSHLDLLYASPITGELLIEAAAANPDEDGWMAAFGERYTEADTINWVDDALAEDEDTGGDDSGDTGDTGGDDTAEDSGDTAVDDTGDLPGGDTPKDIDGDAGFGDCGCVGTPGPASLVGLLAGLAALARRRRG